jgi:hypothetical protein
MVHVVFLLLCSDKVCIWMTGPIPFPLPVVELLLTIMGPHHHSRRSLHLESPRADRTPPQTYTEISLRGFESFFKK